MTLHDNTISAAAFLQDICHSDAVAAGWHTDLKTGVAKPVDVPRLLMLTVSELAEAMEAHRKGLKDDKLPHRDGVEVELADTVIRVFDMAGALGLDLAGAIAEKLEFNRIRPDHKREVRLTAGGKAY